MKTPPNIRDRDLRGAGPALRRAAQAARRIARATDTPLVTWEHGRVVRKRLTGKDTD